jgi:hypothetical protein
MSSSRKIIAEFIGVFLVGALVGGLVTWSFADTKLSMAMSRWNNPQKLEQRITDKYVNEYHLSPDEMARIQPLIKQLAQDLYKVRHQFGLDVVNTLDRDHAAIAAQLTPDHRSAYEAQMKERHDQLSSLLLSDQDSPEAGQK